MATDIEARLRISAQDRTAKAFAAIEKRLARAEQKAKAFNRAQNHVARFEATAARLDRSATHGLRNILLGSTALLGGLTAASGVQQGLGVLTSYEDALIEIAKKGGITAEEMHKVGEEARGLATSGELAVPLNDILASYERAAAAGLPIDEWKEFAALSAKAADAFGMSAEDVGNAAAGFKVGLGIPMTEMERYFDLINSLADSGISDESDIIKFLDNAGAGLKNFGLNAREAAAYGSTLLNLKLGPETGARMMNALTSKLIAPENLGKKGYSALTEVVGSVKAFKRELQKDPQGALRKFIGSLAKLDKFKRARLTGAIFGMEWSDEIMRLVDGVDELDRNLQLAASNDWFGSLSASYQKKLEALSSRWQLFRNEVAELTLDLGEMSMPALEGGLERARGLVKELGENIESFGSKVDQQALADASRSISDMVVAIEDLLKIEGQGSHLTQAFNDLAKVTGDVAAAISVIEKGAKYILNPLGASAQDKGGDPDAPPIERESYLGGALTIDKGGIADSVIGGMKDAHDWMNWWSAELRAAASGSPPPPVPGAAASSPAMRDGGASLPGEGGSSSLVPTPEPINMQIDAPGETVDALRQAMEAGGGEMRQAGTDSAGAIRDAAQELRGAAASIAEGGRQAAQAISGAKIQVPNIPTSRSAPNANLGQSMPNAGMPGSQ